jgi:hypothetical protein
MLLDNLATGRSRLGLKRRQVPKTERLVGRGGHHDGRGSRQHGCRLDKVGVTLEDGDKSTRLLLDGRHTVLTCASQMRTVLSHDDVINASHGSGPPTV